MLILAYVIMAIFVLLCGSSVGSFLNVVIYRVPQGMNVVNGRSFCPNCKTNLKPYDMIPVLSYLFLGGKCRFCHTKISKRYPLVELACGLFAVYLFLFSGMTIKSLCLFLLFVILLAVSLIDLDTMTIPDSMHIALLVLAIAMYFVWPELSLIDRGIGFFAVSLPMFLLSLLSNGGFGGGDIKLMAVCGLILGWKNILVAMFFACIVAGVVAIYLVTIRKINRKSHIPFGPFLSLGIIMAALWGERLLSWYFSLF